MKKKPQTRPVPPARPADNWFAKAGWALAAILLIALGLLEQRHQAESARRRAEAARQENPDLLAERFLSLYTNAPVAPNMVDVLRGIRAVSTDVLLSEAFKTRFEASELKTKLNLETGKRGVPIDPKSKYELALVVDGKWYEADGNVMPMVSLNLNESVPVQRPFGFNLISVASYRAMRFAIVKTNQAAGVVSKMIESLAESFAKDYKTANGIPAAK